MVGEASLVASMLMWERERGLNLTRKRNWPQSPRRMLHQFLSLAGIAVGPHASQEWFSLENAEVLQDRAGFREWSGM